MYIRVERHILDRQFEEFYRQNAMRYSEHAQEYLDKLYTYQNVSDPLLTGDLDIINRMRELIADGCRGLDAGFGAGARDTYLYHEAGYDMVGLEYVHENIRVAREKHPDIAERLIFGDLSVPLLFSDSEFDFVLCNAVIQHIQPALVADVTIPELSRVLKTGGVLQLMFKVGNGIKTVFDSAYGWDRTFWLFEPDMIQSALMDCGLMVIPSIEGKLSGLIHFMDAKPMEHCVLFARKCA